MNDNNHPVAGQSARQARKQVRRMRRAAEIPLPCEYFVEPPFWPLLNMAMQRKSPVLCEGPAGSGKSTAIREYAAREKRRLVLFQCHADTSVEELRGHLGLRDGSTCFVQGLLTLAARSGAILLVEEPNLARPGVLAKMNSVLDESGQISIPETGETIRPADGFQVCFCMNCGYAGTLEMNMALRDRCICIYVDYLPPAEELCVVLRHYPNVRKRDAEAVIATANAVREARRKGSTDFDFSLRTILAWLHDATHRTHSLINSFQAIVLPKLGDPLIHAPQHEALLEIARLNLEHTT